MPKGSQTFSAITLDQPIKTGGSIQFDGKYLAIADYGAGYPTAAVVYRFALSGSSGTRISKTTLDDSLAFGQFWIQGSKIIGPIGYDSIRAIGYWQFPAGGSPSKNFAGPDTYPSGEVVSLK